MNLRETVLLATVVIAGATIGLVVVLKSGGEPPLQPVHADLNNSSENTDEAPKNPGGPLAIRETKSTDERIADIRKLAAAPGTPWNDSGLRQAVVADPNEQVQLAALEESIRLARKEGGDAPSNAVRLGLASNKGNTRAAALKAAKENADPAMVDELIALVDQRDPYAPMALNALAYTNDPKARNKILELVEDESTDRKLRERAIALIGITKDREAIGTLIDLRNGSDHELARLAEEVLKILNQ